jgi:NTE family protein
MSGRRRPDIRIHATDLYYRVPFPFHAALFSILCSDLSRYRVADAVAATMAAPILFAPTVVRTYPDNCQPLPAELAAIRPRRDASRDLNAIAKAVTAYRDPSRTRFIKLGDGGLTDNFAVSTLVMTRLVYGAAHAPMTERDAVAARRLLLIVVDASQGPSGDWTLSEAGPSGVDLALSAVDAAVDAGARRSADAFERMVSEWQASVIAYRCRLTPDEVMRLGGRPEWNCADVKFSLAYLSIDDLESPMREGIEAVPTRLTLKRDQVDATIEGGRAGTLALRGLEEYLRDRGPTSASTAR